VCTTHSHVSPSASPCRSPRASVTDQRAALRRPAAAARIAFASSAVSGRISSRLTLGASIKVQTLRATRPRRWATVNAREFRVPNGRAEQIEALIRDLVRGNHPAARK